MPNQLLQYEEFRGIREELATYAQSKLNLSDNAQAIYDSVYNKTLEDGSRETTADRMAAVAVDIASADMDYFPTNMQHEEKLKRVRSTAQRNLELYVTNTFRANTPTNINMGRWKALYDKDGELTGEYKQKKQLGSACFVIPVGDTFGDEVRDLQDGILEAWVTQQLVHKGGGGTGFAFSRLRPKGSKIEYNPAVDGVQSMDWTAGTGASSGFESFLEKYFNESTDAVKQGNSRRGANMGIQRIDHMDFLDHLFAKYGRDQFRKEFRMKNFNLSMAITDEFMEAAMTDGTYTLFNPHRAEPGIKRVLEKKFSIEQPELVRKEDLATREQFEEITRRNKLNSRNPLTTPSMYLDKDENGGEIVINAYDGSPIGFIVNGIVHIRAKKILDLHSKLSYTNGEPGMVFIDRMNEFNPNLFDEEIEATNPCGEQPLPPYDACNLGSINVGKFARYRVADNEEALGLEKDVLDSPFTKVQKRRDGKTELMYFDWNGLREVIHDGVHFLDNVIDRSDFPAEKITQAVQNYRNIGLGIMGADDAMKLMKMRYGSEESVAFAEEMAKVLHVESRKASAKLAQERRAYPKWETSHHNPKSPLYAWLMSKPKTIPDKFRGDRKLSDKVKREKIMEYGSGPVRNAAMTTEAPTGTIRRSAGEKLEHFLGIEDDPAKRNSAISSGIEPIYTAREFSPILNSEFYDWSLSTIKLLHREGLDTPENLWAIKENGGSVFVYSETPEKVAEVLNKIPEEIKEVLVTAAGGEKNYYEISHQGHVRMLSAFQKYNDSATSKTINVPNSATVEEMKDAWIQLWREGTKGGTIYRDKSREYQILNVEMGERKVEEKGKRRPLVQKSITVELPYISSGSNGIDAGNPDFNPDRVFTTIAYNPVNNKVTGVFQNFPEVNQEIISLSMDRNIEKSGRLKNQSEGKGLDDIIQDMEKMRMSGGKRGMVADTAVMPKDSKEKMRYEVTGSTTTEALLNSLYVIRFLTDSGTKFDEEFVDERLNAYFLGEVTLKSILNTKGQIELAEGGDRPSILPNGKIIKLPEAFTEDNCPECEVA